MEKTVKGVADEVGAVGVAAGEAEATSGAIGMVTILVEKRNLGKTVIIIATRSKPRWSRGSVPSSHARGQRFKP